MKAHDFLVRALVALETMPVFEHGEKAEILVGDLFYVVDTLEARCNEPWVRLLRADVRELLWLFVAGTRPESVARKRLQIIAGLKRALAEKIL